MCNDAVKALLAQDRPALWLRKYAIRTRKGYVQRVVQGREMAYIFLTPNIEKAIMLDTRGEAIQMAMAIKANGMEAVIDMLKPPPMAGRTE